jgi:hypothetical protein
LKRRSGSLVLSILGGLALLLGVPALALVLMFPPERLTPLVRDGLARALDSRVSLTRASLAFVPQPAVRLEGVVIGDPRDYRRPAAWPHPLSRGPRPIGWLSGRESRAPAARLPARRGGSRSVRNEDGLGNWEALLKRKPSQLEHATPSFTLSLDGLALAPGRFSYYDARDGAWFDVHRLEGKLALATGNGGRSQRLRLVARASGLGGRTGWPIGARPIELAADLDGRNRGEDTPDWLWTIRKLGLKRGALELTGKGTITGPDQVLAFQLDQTRVPLNALLELLPRDQQQAGRPRGRARSSRPVAQGPLAHGKAPHVRARDHAGRLARVQSRALAIEQLAFDVVANEPAPTCPGSRAGSAARVPRLGVVRSWSDPRLKAHVEANTDLAEVALPPARFDGAPGARIALDGAGPPDRRFDGAGRSRSRTPRQGLGLGYPVDGIHGTIGLAGTRGATADRPPRQERRHARRHDRPPV